MQLLSPGAVKVVRPSVQASSEKDVTVTSDAAWESSARKGRREAKGFMLRSGDEGGCAFGEGCSNIEVQGDFGSVGSHLDLGEDRALLILHTSHADGIGGMGFMTEAFPQIIISTA
jgi:hypothetical protein